MMTDEAAFLRMIADRPDEDGPRLVFADWLEERGLPDLAELVRIDCEIRARDIAGCTCPEDEYGTTSDPDCYYNDGTAKLIATRDVLLTMFGVQWSRDSGYPLRSLIGTPMNCRPPRPAAARNLITSPAHR